MDTDAQRGRIQRPVRAKPCFSPDEATAPLLTEYQQWYSQRGGDQGEWDLDALRYAMRLLTPTHLRHGVGTEIGTERRRRPDFRYPDMGLGDGTLPQRWSTGADLPVPPDALLSITDSDVMAVAAVIDHMRGPYSTIAELHCALNVSLLRTDSAENGRAAVLHLHKSVEDAVRPSVLLLLGHYYLLETSRGATAPDRQEKRIELLSKHSEQLRTVLSGFEKAVTAHPLPRAVREVVNETGLQSILGALRSALGAELEESMLKDLALYGVFQADAPARNMDYLPAQKLALLAVEDMLLEAGWKQLRVVQLVVDVLHKLGLWPECAISSSRKSKVETLRKCLCTWRKQLAP